MKSIIVENNFLHMGSFEQGQQQIEGNEGIKEFMCNVIDRVYNGPTPLHYDMYGIPHEVKSPIEGMFANAKARTLAAQSELSQLRAA
jgi:hypothetical protein